MKIMIVSQYYNPDPFRLHEAAEALVKKGHEITVLTGTPNYVSKEAIKNSKTIITSGKNNGVNIIRVPTFRRRWGLFGLALSYISFLVSASFKAMIVPIDFDVIFVYQLSPIIMVIPAWILRKRSKKKLSLYCLDLWPESIVGMGITHNSFLYKLMRNFSIKAYNSVDCLGYTSKSFKKYFLEDLKLITKNYMYIPQFAEDIYSSIEQVQHEGINYVFAGNIGDAQAVETIIKAAQIVQNPNIKWHIVGDGSSYKKCIDLAVSLKVTDRVLFYGRKPITDMPGLFAIADALVVTLSSNEIIGYTLPGKVQSYMASGIPILAAASGETEAIIRDAQCGLCCKSEDYHGLAKIAEEMVNENRKMMGLNAKKYYQTFFTKEKYIDSLIELLTYTD